MKWNDVFSKNWHQKVQPVESWWVGQVLWLFLLILSVSVKRCSWSSRKRISNFFIRKFRLCLETIHPRWYFGTFRWKSLNFAIGSCYIEWKTYSFCECLFYWWKNKSWTIGNSILLNIKTKVKILKAIDQQRCHTLR